MVCELLVLALEYHRAPLRYRHLSNPQTPLPPGFDALFREFCIALLPQNLDATARSLDVTAREIDDASLFFLRHAMLFPGADHYRVLGLSRVASQENIRRHYRLVILMFHPDRFGAESERGSKFTARINVAYATLRAVDRRQRYDRALVSRGSCYAAPDLRDFFLPEDPITDGIVTDGGYFARLMRLRRHGVWFLIAFVLAISAFFAYRSTEEPHLHANPGLAGRSWSGPAFLQNGSRGSDQSKRHAVAPSWFSGGELVAASRETGSLDERAAPGTTRIEGIDVRARTELNKVLDHLSDYYETGDLEGFMSLFTADAISNSGRGRESIRANYGELFSRVERRRLSFSRVSWRVARRESIVGKGLFRVSSTLDEDSGWQHESGTIGFELVPWNGSYRVSKMTHWLERR